MARERVYLLEEGEYEDHGVVDVYATLEAAKAACPPGLDWQVSPDGKHWYTGSIDITEYKVKE